MQVVKWIPGPRQAARPGMTERNKKGLPSFATAGLCCREKFRDGYATQRLLDLIDLKTAR
jgi:hypothetical protein